MRFVVLIILVVAAVWLIRRALRSGAAPKQNAEGGASVEDLIRCARCGVHLPRVEARESGGRLFCGEEHARLGAGEG